MAPSGVRRLRTDAEAEQAWQLTRRSFNLPAGDREGFLGDLDPDRALAVFLGPEMASLARSRPFGMFFGGRPVPMGGLSGVTAAPEHRGRGHASAATVAHFPELLERGEVLSALFPASTGLYRRLGFEVAGAWGSQAVPARSLAALRGGESLTVRRAARDDLDAIRACYRRLARHVNGHLDRPEVWWKRTLERVWDERHAYVVDQGDRRLAGYVVYEHTAAPAGWGYGIRVHELVADHVDAASALWRLVGSSSTQVAEVVVNGPPEHPLLLLLSEQDLTPRQSLRWMLRLVDAPGAVAARGFPPEVQAEVDLEVHDGDCPWNAGRWRLTVEGGRGRLERGGNGAVSLRAGALACLYAGYAPAARLASAGLVSGAREEHLGALSAAFAGPTPWMPDFF